MRRPILTLTLAALAFAGLSAASGPAPAGGPVIESRYAKITGCREIAHGKNGEDWLAYRCAGLPGWPLWRLYNEGVRMRLGFGARQNYSGMFAAERDDRWPVEYRGEKSGRRFRPFAAIVRVRNPGEGSTSFLAVYRLQEDAASCIIGTVDGPGDNAKAQAMADASRKHFTCADEPYMP